MAKFLKVADTIKARIKRGDYALKDVPTEQRLASETGVSRMTVRKAVKQLVDEGFLERLPNGRIGIRRGRRKGPLHPQIAVLTPAYWSRDVEMWRNDIECVAEQYHAYVRQVAYLHPDDPVIADVLQGFDGVFMIPSGDPVPAEIAATMRNSEKPVVVLNWDMSALGIRSINLFPPAFIRNLLDYVAGLGHRSVDCFNAQPEDIDIEQRIGQWQVWKAEHGFAGQLINVEVKPYDNAIKLAHRAMDRRLASGRNCGSAIVCTTMPAAVAVLRALHEHGIVAGTDLSVCAINDDGTAAFHVPSIAHIVRPDTTPYLKVCLEWMVVRKGREWMGPLCLQTTGAVIFKGESLGAVRQNPKQLRNRNTVKHRRQAG